MPTSRSAGAGALERRQEQQQIVALCRGRRVERRRGGRALAGVLVGVGGRYEVGLSRDAVGTLLPDQRVSPMTALSLALHGERGDGLLAGGLRAEASRRWSSERNWENALRIDGEAELTPLAVNDRPVSLFAAARADAGGGLPHPDLHFVVGVRFSEPLTSRSAR